MTGFIDKSQAGRVTEFRVTEGERLDLRLVRLGLAKSRRDAREMIERGRVRVNGRRWRKGDVVAAGDGVEVIAAPDACAIAPDTDGEIPVLYEDADLLVVAKPAPMACHPLRPGERGTVMNTMAARFPETLTAGPKPAEGGLIHRLDNGTSGALMIARTADACATMRAALKAGGIARRYLALAAGPIERAIEIAAPIAHHAKNPRRMIMPDYGGHERSRSAAWRSAPRPAISLVTPLQRRGDFTLVEVTPATGVRHQIRVHLASLGCPIVGDTLYGGPESKQLGAGRFWLHLAELEFTAPAGARVHPISPTPADLEAALAAIA